jgi:Mn2+/Fe2+ NRAMP family transporter
VFTGQRSAAAPADRGIEADARGAERLVKPIVGLVLLANIINIGADLGAMGAVLHLLVGGSAQLYVVVFAVTYAVLRMWTKYERYVAALKWTTVSLLAYVACGLVVGVAWREVVWHTLIPTVNFDSASVLAMVAVLGRRSAPISSSGNPRTMPRRRRRIRR